MEHKVSPLTKALITTANVQERVDLIASNLDLCAQAIDNLEEHRDDGDDYTHFYLALRLLVLNLIDVFGQLDEVHGNLSSLVKEGVA